MLPNSPDDDQPPSYEASAACASKARMKWRPRADTADDVQPATAEPNSVPPAHQPATDHPPTYFHNSASGDVVVVPEVLCPELPRNHLLNKDPRTCWNAYTFVPAIPLGMCIIVLLVNLVIPGMGTLMGGLCLCCDMGHPFKTSQTNSDVLLPCIIIGLAQFLSTVFLLAGWIWALAWSILFCTCSWQYYTRPLVVVVPETSVTISNTSGTQI